MTDRLMTLRESRARRRAIGNGLRVLKSRSRSPDHYAFGGFMIVDTDTNFAVAGSLPEFCFSLEDVENFLGITSAIART